MEKLKELKTTLSAEWKKPKSDRNYELIHNIQEQIQEQKTIWHKQYKKRQKEKHVAEVSVALSLFKKKNDAYGKIREEKKKERLEREKKERGKLQPKKKAKQ